MEMTDPHSLVFKATLRPNHDVPVGPQDRALPLPPASMATTVADQ